MCCLAGFFFSSHQIFIKYMYIIQCRVPGSNFTSIKLILQREVSFVNYLMLCYKKLISASKPLGLVWFFKQFEKTLKPFHSKNDCFHVSRKGHVSNCVVCLPPLKERGWQIGGMCWLKAVPGCQKSKVNHWGVSWRKCSQQIYWKAPEILVVHKLSEIQQCHDITKKANIILGVWTWASYISHKKESLYSTWHWPGLSWSTLYCFEHCAQRKT